MFWRLYGRAVPQCDKCGKPKALIVGGGLMVASDKEDVEGGRVVFVGNQVSDLPEWICLTCFPKWSQLNAVASQLFDWQMAKENAIVGQDFTLAAEFRDRQDSMRRLLRELVIQINSGTT